jgi:hypothetical protein
MVCHKPARCPKHAYLRTWKAMDITSYSMHQLYSEIKMGLFGLPWS